MASPSAPEDMISEDTARDNAARAAFIHHEILQLFVLILIAIAAFFATRAVAASNRNMSLRDAAAWYQRGERALDEGRVSDAIEAFRRAAVRDRHAKMYVLALARALARNRDDDAARGVLSTLRESEPEDAEINLELARLAARRDDVTEALRFYHNALYAPWPAELIDARRDVRLEFIRFLLAHNQSGPALAELLAVAADLPDQLAAHREVAQLFAEAGDYTRSLDEFQRALRLTPNDGAALAGAGLGAFHIGQYALARTYLRRAPADLGEVAATRDIIESVLSNDPLANGIGSAERRRRLTADLDYARQRLSACVATRAGSAATNDEVTLQGEADRFYDRLKPAAALDQDTIEAGVDLIDRMARDVVQRCGPASARDRALVLIGRQHAGDSK
jgi:tetratricopeptide (TPR) repeat protein